MGNAVLTPAVVVVAATAAGAVIVRPVMPAASETVCAREGGR